MYGEATSYWSSDSDSRSEGFDPIISPQRKESDPIFTHPEAGYESEISQDLSNESSPPSNSNFFRRYFHKRPSSNSKSRRKLFYHSTHDKTNLPCTSRGSGSFCASRFSPKSIIERTKAKKFNPIPSNQTQSPRSAHPGYGYGRKCTFQTRNKGSKIRGKRIEIRGKGIGSTNKNSDIRKYRNYKKVRQSGPRVAFNDSKGVRDAKRPDCHDKKNRKDIFITGSKDSSKVLCQVCLHYRNAKKYKRHLKYHLKHGRIGLKQMHRILFQTRYTRHGSRNSKKSLKTGSTCTIENCQAVVIDLHTHLTKIHALDPSDGKYIEAFLNCEHFHREVFYKQNSHKYNPMADLTGKISLSPQVLDSVEQSLTSSQYQEGNSDIDENFVVHQASFHSPINEYSNDDDDDDDDDDEGQDSAAVNSNDNATQLRELLNSIISFRDHSFTISGGSRSDAFTKMDVRNIIYILDSVGVQNLFSTSELNSHFTDELRSDKSPSTLYSHVLSFSRFIEYLKIHRIDLLPKGKPLDMLLSDLRGMVLSLNKMKKRRQQIIMTKSRGQYSDTIQVLKQWRRNRTCESYLSTFEQFRDGMSDELYQEDFLKMRNFLITELIIPNGLRPGVISGIIVKEVSDAKLEITEEGYHKILVSNHKTGYIQTATLFVYPEVYISLEIFVKHIMKMLPFYRSHPRQLTNSSLVFQTFEGRPIPSPRITPILRCFLNQLGIYYKGTLTDLRKAAATLTGKFDPKLSDMMALFLGHSRRAHDRYYRINIGHPGLSEAFHSLEEFQTNPDVIRHNAHMKPSSSLNVLRDESLLNLGSFQASSPDINMHSDDQEPLELNHVSTDDILSSTEIPHEVDALSTRPLDFSGTEQLISNGYNSILDGSVCSMSVSSGDSNTSAHRSLIGLQSFQESEHCHQDISNEVSREIFKLKKFHICMDEKNCCIKHNASRKRAHPRNIFMQEDEEEVFQDVFSHFIHRISSHLPVTRKEILEHAHNSHKFSPILTTLFEIYTEETVHKKIYNKVRSLAMFSQQNDVDPQTRFDESDRRQLLNLSKNSQMFLREKGRNKSIFTSIKDEILFRTIFSDLINRVANKQPVTKYQILERTTDVRFFPVLNRLKLLYSDDVYTKLINKVRTVGRSKR